MYEVIVLGNESGLPTQQLDYGHNKYFEFATVNEALRFAEICWINGYETLIRKTELGPNLKQTTVGY